MVIQDVHLPDVQYFLLAYPICLSLIGAVFIATHLGFQAPKYLFWLGLACIFPSIGLAAQTLMSNAQLRLTAPWLALFYLGGAWAVAHGMLLKANSKSGGVSKSMLALNKSVIKVKESQIKGFKIISELLRKVATFLNSTLNSLTISTFF